MQRITEEVGLSNINNNVPSHSLTLHGSLRCCLSNQSYYFESYFNLTKISQNPFNRLSQLKKKKAFKFNRNNYEFDGINVKVADIIRTNGLFTFCRLCPLKRTKMAKCILPIEMGQALIHGQIL